MPLPELPPVNPDYVDPVRGVEADLLNYDFNLKMVQNSYKHLTDRLAGVCAIYCGLTAPTFGYEYLGYELAYRKSKTGPELTGAMILFECGGNRAQVFVSLETLAKDAEGITKDFLTRLTGGVQ